MEVRFCPYCGFETSIKQKPCGWKYYCDECNKLLAILDVSHAQRNFIGLFDTAMKVEEDRRYVPKKFRETNDGGVSL